MTSDDWSTSDRRTVEIAYRVILATVFASGPYLGFWIMSRQLHLLGNSTWLTATRIASALLVMIAIGWCVRSLRRFESQLRSDADSADSR